MSKAWKKSPVYLHYHQPLKMKQFLWHKSVFTEVMCSEMDDFQYLVENSIKTPIMGLCYTKIQESYPNNLIISLNVCNNSKYFLFVLKADITKETCVEIVHFSCTVLRFFTYFNMIFTWNSLITCYKSPVYLCYHQWYKIMGFMLPTWDFIEERCSEMDDFQIFSWK